MLSILGVGKLSKCYCQLLGKQYNNVTLGFHSQESLSTPNAFGERYNITKVYIGLYFFRNSV